MGEGWGQISKGIPSKSAAILLFTQTNNLRKTVDFDLIPMLFGIVPVFAYANLRKKKVCHGYPALV
jgi:hypothetical protein